jgi:hypothetical protein
MSEPCCGCSGGAPAVPLPTDNPPQQDALRRRIGTHGTFLAALKAGLSAPLPEGAESPLASLTRRDAGDPTIALLDAWATVADVLTFYQERFANEAYLRTATERRSVLELARLVDYDLRPGVAASLPLAFTLDATDPKARATVPAGTPAQSIPGPGEVPQTFETSDDLPARAEWNLLPVRTTRPQALDLDRLANAGTPSVLYLRGIATNLKPADRLLLVLGDKKVVVTVSAVAPDSAASRTAVTLAPAAAAPPANAPAPGADGGSDPNERLKKVLNRLDERITLNRRPAVPADRTLRNTLLALGGTARTDVGGRLLVAVQPALGAVLYQALRNQQTPLLQTQPDVYVFRVRSGLFGSSAMSLPIVPSEPPPRGQPPKPIQRYPWLYAPADTRQRNLIWLDTPYPQIVPGTFVAVQKPSQTTPDVYTIKTASTPNRDDYNLSTRTTQLELDRDWSVAADDTDNLGRLRGTTVYAQAEKLDLDEEPIPDDDVAVGAVPGHPDQHSDRVEMQDIVPDLDAGRLILFSGERADLPDVSGIPGSELARLTAVELKEPGDMDQYQRPLTRRISVLHLDSPLSYTYRRSTLKLYGNVALATNGESRNEVLGGGDASEAWSAYTVRQFPVTQLPAPTPSGAVSTLQVRVHGVLWHEFGRLADAGPKDQVYETKTSDDGHTTVIFGDGVHGARPATDVENIRAALRVGLGLGGNVRAGQVSLLTRPPAGVLMVTNPLPGTGGADPEGRDRARRNAPLGTLTLDRLVSLTDYAAFARSFAGIGKAEGVELSDARGRFIELTVAGSDDLPLAPESELLINLRQALARDGDPRQLVQIDPRERVLLVLQAGVRINPDYLWPDIDAALRQALVAGFPFENRGMGRDMFLSEVVAVLQGVAGVLEVEVDVFDGVAERAPGTYKDPSGKDVPARLLLTPNDLAAAVAAAVSRALPPPGQGKGPRERVSLLSAGIDNGTVRPAQIAYFGPETLDVLKAAVTFRRIV